MRSFRTLYDDRPIVAFSATSDDDVLPDLAELGPHFIAGVVIGGAVEVGKLDALVRGLLAAGAAALGFFGPQARLAEDLADRAIVAAPGYFDGPTIPTTSQAEVDPHEIIFETLVVLSLGDVAKQVAIVCLDDPQTASALFELLRDPGAAIHTATEQDDSN